MPDGSAIEMLTRYHRGSTSDPVENQMTAALAALLSESEELRTRVATHYLSNEWEPTYTDVKLQRPIGGDGGWVDLELVVGEPHRRAIIWIEAKYASPLSEQQLEKYAAALRTIGTRTASRLLLLLLAPESERPRFRQVASWPGADHARDLFPYFTSWQDLCECLSAPPATQAEPNLTWLHQEVLAYLTGRLATLSARRNLTPSAIDQDTQALFNEVRIALNHKGWRPSDHYHYVQKSFDPAFGHWKAGYLAVLPGQRRSNRSAVLECRIEPPYLLAGVRFDTPAGGAIRSQSDSTWASQLLAICEVPDGAEPWRQHATGSRDYTSVVCRRELPGTDGDETSLNARAKSAAEFVDGSFRTAMAARNTAIHARSRRSDVRPM